MAIFNSSSNPCFAGHCLAALEDGTLVRVDSIRRGDRLLGGSVVRCVVRTATPTGAALVRIGGMLVTEWHPVRVDGAWCFPAELGAAQWEEGCEAVYSFLLDGPVHEMLVGDVWGVTLGHGAVGDVREHAFLGTDRVREALAGMPGWEDGVMEVSGTVRDPDTGLVCGFAPAAPRREAERAEGGAPLPAEPCVCAC